MYNSTDFEKIRNDEELNEALTKKKLIKKITNATLKRKLTLRSLDDKAFRTSLLKMVIPDVLRMAIPSYIMHANVSGWLRSDFFEQSNSGYDLFGCAVSLNVTEIIQTFCRYHHLEVNTNTVGNLVAEIFEYDTELDDISLSAYSRCSIVKDLIEVLLFSKYDHKYISSHSQSIKYILSAIRLSLLIKDLTTLEAYEYMHMIDCMNAYIKLESSDEINKINKIQHSSNPVNANKSFYNNYKVEYRHLDLLEYFSENWYSKLVLLICDKDSDDEKGLIFKLGKMSFEV